MSDNEFNVDFDDEIESPEKYENLKKAINKLDKTQHIKKPKREGYSELKSEFHVSKSGSLALKDIVKVLGKKRKHADLSKKIEKASTSIKTLPKPIEKHVAEKAKRLTGFEEVKENLGKWDAIVSRNRSVPHQKFPLESVELKKGVKKQHLDKFSLKSELEKELELLEPVETEAAEDMFPMTMTEMLEHRKEAARLRAKQSYKEAKSRRQNKIKSKKFHRILRKERTRQQLKEFEVLQKTDPEQALKKLEELEKSRAQERVTLRHKSTGQWAKNKLVRAKYDKETRQQLAEQLAISRDLTLKQKTNIESESEEETETAASNHTDPLNPWLTKVQHSDEVADFVSGYRKYWEERNKTSANNTESNKITEEENVKDATENNKNLSENKNIPDVQEEARSHKEPIKKVSDPPKQAHDISLEMAEPKIKAICVNSTSEWIVENISLKPIPTKQKAIPKVETEKSIDNLFDDLEWKIQKRVTNKINNLNSAKTMTRKQKRKVKKVKEHNFSSGLEFKKQNIRPVIDEEMDEGFSELNQKVHQPTKISRDVQDVNVDRVNNIDQIDPEKFVAIKPKHLQTTLPDMETEEDHLDDDDDLKKITIAEAFEDDDIVAEFQQEKESERNKNNIKLDDLNLPGWGSWAGKNMKAPRRRRRMFSNIPKVLPRKDDKKDTIIINESKDSKLRVHQVSELPFPFTSVSDFEASIRAPIGNTFIPQTAHRKLTKPSVVVKTGVIVEPMDETQLLTLKRGNLKVPLTF